MRKATGRPSLARDESPSVLGSLQSGRSGRSTRWSSSTTAPATSVRGGASRPPRPGARRSPERSGARRGRPPDRRCRDRPLPAGRTPTTDPDPVEILSEQARGRLPELVPIRNGRMLASPFAFFRGSAAVMAADLAATPSSGLQAQLCGDAHVSNFGGFASPERKMVFDLNDFDETLPGPECLSGWARASRSRAGRAGSTPINGGVGARRHDGLSRGDARVRRDGQPGGLVCADDLWGHPRPLGGAKQQGVRAHVPQRVKKASRKNSASATSKLARLVDGQYQMISAPPLGRSPGRPGG